jgi:hypothetical protein
MAGRRLFATVVSPSVVPDAHLLPLHLPHSLVLYPIPPSGTLGDIDYTDRWERRTALGVCFFVPESGDERIPDRRGERNARYEGR